MSKHFNLIQGIIIFLCVFTSLSCFSQNVGDSIHFITNSNRKYVGTIEKVIKDGYFFKNNTNRSIYLSKKEVKEYQIFKEPIDIKKDSVVNITDIKNSAIDFKKDTIKIIPNIKNSGIEIEKQDLVINEADGFYKKYDLKNLAVDDLNPYKGDLGKFYRRIKIHLIRSQELTFIEKIRFKKNLISELNTNPNEKFLKYKKTKRNGYRLVVVGGLTMLIGEHSDENGFKVFGLAAIGVSILGYITYTVGLIKLLNSKKKLYKSFYYYLEEKNN
tara:strand:+ start:2067 stop:2882 length:816 start_codon:yes stop_codon:yes gene_type:complete